MKHLATVGVIVLVVSAGIVAISAQGRRGAPPPALEPGASQADVDRAVLAAPEALRNAATVVKWKADFTYDTLRKGTSRLVCYEKSGLPGQAAFESQCTSLANLERVAQNLRFEAETDRAKRQAALDAAEKDGTRVKPEFGSVFYTLTGQDPSSARGHMTVAVPGATTVTLGLPEDGTQGGIWIMNAGTTTAHLMIPGH